MHAHRTARPLGPFLLATAIALGAGRGAPAQAAGPSSSPPAPSPPAAAPPLKVGFAYVGPVGDAGWTFAHDKARKAVEAEFGPKVTTIFVENVPEAADAERVLRDMVKQG